MGARTVPCCLGVLVVATRPVSKGEKRAEVKARGADDAILRGEEDTRGGGPLVDAGGEGEHSRSRGVLWVLWVLWVLKTVMGSGRNWSLPRMPLYKL